MTEGDVSRFKKDICPRAVIDLRSPEHADKELEVRLLGEIGAQHYHIPFRPDSSGYMNEEAEANPNATNLGQIYLYRISEKAYGKRLIDALEIIADANNQPLVIHCTVGKDRTGVLAAMFVGRRGRHRRRHN
jgi:protein tyrosine/serine phosphatase